MAEVVLNGNGKLRSALEIALDTPRQERRARSTQRGLPTPYDLPDEPSFQSLGIPGTLRYRGLIYDDYVGELNGLPKIQTYEKMRSDGIVEAMLTALKLPIVAATWIVEARGRDANAVKAADLVQRQLFELLGTCWEDEVRQLLPFQYGFHVAAKNWSLVNGEAVLSELRHLHPRTVVMGGKRWQYDDASDPSKLTGLVQWGTDGIIWKEQYLPRDRFIHCLHDGDYKNPEGRALALDTPIPTLDGWEVMGNLRVGDRVFDEQGKPCTVVAVSPVWQDRPCFEVEFSDGTTIVADENHEWASFTWRARHWSKSGAPEIMTTKELARTMRQGRMNNHAIQLAKPLDLPEIELPVDPYVLGYWLGDGCRESGRIISDDLDAPIEIKRRGYSVQKRKDWEVSRGWHVYGLTLGLREIGVFSVKHIPELYLRASIGQRLDLLRGLMDSDGHIDKFGRAEFSNTNKDLVDGVVELARSLGWRPTVQYVRQGGQVAVMKNGSLIKSKKDIYRVHFTAGEQLFYVERKGVKQNTDQAKKQPYRYVVDVRPTERRPTVCIEVDSPSHLFLASEAMIPTHNSVLRSGYKHWRIRDQLYRIQAVGLEKAAVSTPVGTYPANTYSEKLRQDLGNSLANLVAGGGGLTLPDDVKLENFAQQLKTQDIIHAIDHHATCLVLSILAGFLVLGHTGRGGAYSLATDLSDLFMLTIEAWADYLASKINRELVPEMVHYNIATDRYPFVSATISRYGLAQISTYLSSLSAGAMPFITPDEGLEDFLRERAQFPPRPDNQNPLARQGELQPSLPQGATTRSGVNQPAPAPPSAPTGRPRREPVLQQSRDRMAAFAREYAEARGQRVLDLRDVQPFTVEDQEWEADGGARRAYAYHRGRVRRFLRD